jgi:hypothetical protein
MGDRWWNASLKVRYTLIRDDGGVLHLGTGPWVETLCDGPSWQWEVTARTVDDMRRRLALGFGGLPPATLDAWAPMIVHFMADQRVSIGHEGNAGGAFRLCASDDDPSSMTTKPKPKPKLYDAGTLPGQ